EFVKKNFEYVILGIVVVSLLPVVIEWVSAVREGRREREQQGQSGDLGSQAGLQCAVEGVWLWQDCLSTNCRYCLLIWMRSGM
ncbi:MAG: hypothetical protein ACK6EB_02355, partial [Planctomyces sp.]